MRYNIFGALVLIFKTISIYHFIAAIRFWLFRICTKWSHCLYRGLNFSKNYWDQTVTHILCVFCVFSCSSKLVYRGVSIHLCPPQNATARIRRTEFHANIVAFENGIFICTNMLHLRNPAVLDETRRTIVSHRFRMGANESNSRNKTKKKKKREIYMHELWNSSMLKKLLVRLIRVRNC